MKHKAFINNNSYFHVNGITNLYVLSTVCLEYASMMLCHATFCIINLKWWHLFSVQNECKAVFQERVKGYGVSGEDGWGVVCLEREELWWS